MHPSNITQHFYPFLIIAKYPGTIPFITYLINSLTNQFILTRLKIYFSIIFYIAFMIVNGGSGLLPLRAMDILYCSCGGSDIKQSVCVWMRFILCESKHTLTHWRGFTALN
eukprot:960431_1